MIEFITALSFLFPSAPAILAVTLPLSYRRDKPNWVLWSIGLSMAIIGCLCLGVLIWILSALAGTTGNPSDIHKAATYLFISFGGWKVLIIALLPFFLSYFLFINLDLWAWRIRSPTLEAIVVYIFVAVIPAVLSYSLVLSFSAKVLDIFS